MSSRRQFDSKMTSEVFVSFYWYKAELEQICREYKLPTYGTKAELTDYIVKFLDGVPSSNIKSVRKIRRDTSKKLQSMDIGFKYKVAEFGLFS